jgi:hypothetical protein
MGDIIKNIKVEALAPSQKILYKGAIRTFIENHFTGYNPKTILFPVAEHPFLANKLVLLGRHHEACIADALSYSGCIADTLKHSDDVADELGNEGEGWLPIVDAQGWLVKSKTDFPPVELLEGYCQRNITETNEEIEERFDNIGRILVDPNLRGTIREMRDGNSVLDNRHYLEEFAREFGIRLPQDGTGLFRRIA